MDDAPDPATSLHRLHRRRRAAITLTVVGVLMLGTFVYAAAYFEGWVGGRAAKPAASPACTPGTAGTPAVALKPSAVTINVYNATSRQGLAASVAKSLRTQGFKISKVANDPLSRGIQGVGEVRHGRTGAVGAALAATRLAGVKLVPDARTDNTVDLVLGNTFASLTPPPKAVPANGNKASPSPTGPC